MYRLLIHSGTMFQKLIKWTTKQNDRTKNIYLSFSHFGPMYKKIENRDYHKSTSYTESGKPLTRKVFVNYLKTTLMCPAKVATDIWLAYPVLGDRFLNDVDKNVNILTEEGVTIKAILDNPPLLSLSEVSLRERLTILKCLMPDKVEDFLPLALVADTRLNEIKEIAEREADVIPSRHRIYYFSKLLETEPYTLSKHIVPNRLFMLTLPFKEVNHRIKTMLTYKTPAQIISNLRLIKNSEQFLESLRQANLNENLNLEHNLSMAQYYANRLDYDIEKVETMLKIYPFLASMDVNMVDKKLDFLLKEVGVSASAIVYSPRTLLTRLDKMKQRFQELEFYGFGCQGHQQILVKISLSEKKYSEFLVKLKEEWEQQQNERNSFVGKLRKMFSF
ncbi:uncharacterized protein LOC119066696 [Bradysia coprophila]|uniref:uncharacterized protein LOC119066696 n=1 Tax=Bradysia coprophila TaxID=38358 RepID=UPI00187DCE11|nr:uncharacterized protein LOC119066696 [Bradysia coprophila]